MPINQPKRCPHCGQNAPLVHRGALTYCTACGRARAPFSTKSVTLAGEPSRVGGTVASVAGAVVLVLGLMTALAVGLVFQALFPLGFAGWGIGGMIAALSVAVGVTLLVGGRSLQRRSRETARAVHEQAIVALAAHRKGVVTSEDVALALAIPLEQADRELTVLLQSHPGMSLELDDDGKIFYQFKNLLAGDGRGLTPGFRIATAEPTFGDEETDDALSETASPEPPRRGAL